MDNCTVVSNQSLSEYGAVQVSIMRNNIMLYNDPPYYYMLYMTNDISPLGNYNNCTDPYVDIPGTITDDPVFVNAAADDYRLMSSSPCIDAGTNYWTWSNTLMNTVLVDFGPNPSSGNWNNATNLSAGTIFADMILSDGGSSGWQLDFAGAFDFFRTGAPLHDGVTYPESAYADSVGVLKATYSNTVVISGLDTGRFYSITFTSSGTGDVTTAYWTTPEKKRKRLLQVHEPQRCRFVSPDNTENFTDQRRRNSYHAPLFIISSVAG